MSIPREGRGRKYAERPPECILCGLSAWWNGTRVVSAYCKFTFTGDPAEIRGFITLQDLGGSNTRLLYPAFATQLPTPTPTATSTATATETVTATATGTNTPTSTATATWTPVPTDTATATATGTNPPTPAATATATTTVPGTVTTTATPAATANAGGETGTPP